MPVAFEFAKHLSMLVNYASCGLSPQMYNIPVILEKAAVKVELQLSFFIHVFTNTYVEGIGPEEENGPF